MRLARSPEHGILVTLALQAGGRRSCRSPTLQAETTASGTLALQVEPIGPRPAFAATIANGKAATSRRTPKEETAASKDARATKQREEGGRKYIEITKRSQFSGVLDDVDVLDGKIVRNAGVPFCHMASFWSEGTLEAGGLGWIGTGDG
jgi:hypothetical protein